MNKFNLFVTIFTVAMLLMGCSSNQQFLENLNVTFENEGATMPTEFQTYTVQLTDSAGDVVDVDEVYLYMNMERMNHPIEGTMHNISEGVYELELPLAMAGEWYANITVTNDGDVKLFEGFVLYAEGERQMEFMKGYNADKEN